MSATFRKTELEPVFPGLRAAEVQPWISESSVFAVATFQPARKGIDMSQLSEEAQAFKDEALEKFYYFLGLLRKTLYQCVNSGSETAGGDQGIEDSATVIACNSHCQAGPGHDGGGDELDVEAIAGLNNRRAWINAGDPATGLPCFTQFGERGATGYDEVGGLEAIGCTGKMLVATPYGPCFLASHPVFGVNMYPATIFVAGEATVLMRALRLLTDASQR
jgi:hypothetical protein